MLDIKFIRENQEAVKEAIKNKKIGLDLDELLNLDNQRRELLKKIEDLRAKQKSFNDEIRDQKSETEKQKTLDRMKEIKTEIQRLENELKEVSVQFDKLMLEVPNIPLSYVKVGKDESENEVIKKVGEPKKFDFEPKDHIELGRELDIIDIGRATKVSGSRFGYFKGDAALLEMALVNFVFKTLTSPETVKQIADSVEPGYLDKAFIPVIPPVIINPEPFRRMARLSDADKDERYYLEQDDQYLIGSAEHTLGAMHMDETFKEQELPIRYIGFSTCFRREAGSYGKDTKGMLRVHQFDKLEMESFSLPENSEKEHKFFIAIQEYLVQSLKLPYQVVMVCTGDMGKPDASQFDIETWIPTQNKYRETHTADLMTDYQARRLNTRVKRKDGKLEFTHMNDATAIAIGRILIAIIENYQNEDGSVTVPEVLRPYVGKDIISKVQSSNSKVQNGNK